MNITQFLARAPSYLEEQYAIHLIGSSGIGKSDAVRQLRDNLSLRYGHEVGLSTNLVQSLTPPDVMGFLMGNTRKITDRNGIERDVLMSEFSMPPWCISDTGVPMENYQTGIVFFDEYGQSDPDTKRSLGEPILHVRAGRNQLHDGIGVILASNDVQHRSGVTKSFDFIINRTTEWHLKPHLLSWLNWAILQNIHPLWMAYAKQRPHLIFSDEHPDKQGPWLTPRSYVRFTKILTKDYMPGGMLTEDSEARELMLEEGCGAIGEASTEDIFTWVKVQHDVPTVEQVLKSPETALLPTRPDALTLIIYMLVHAATSKNIDPLARYVERMNPEFITPFVTALGRRNRSLLVDKSVRTKLTARNSALINAIASL